MKYLLTFLLVLTAAVVCGAGLAVGSWWLNGNAATTANELTLWPRRPTATPAVATRPATPTPVRPTPVQPNTNSPNTDGPFSGTFAGTLYGSSGSSAAAALELTQTDDTISGLITIDRGLVIDGGTCGRQSVPAGQQLAEGQTNPTDPNRMDAEFSFAVQGLSITIELEAEVSADGETLAAEAVIDLPFICGRDPRISGEFERQ